MNIIILELALAVALAVAVGGSTLQQKGGQGLYTYTREEQMVAIPSHSVHLS